MPVKVLMIKQDILNANNQIALANQKLLNKHNILMINIMSSPGSGKTSLILRTIDLLREKARIGVIEGDIASTVDADKINKQGIPVVQINTAGACHLDANMIEKALHSLPLDKIDLLFIENIGNLICTADFALGEHKKVMLLSIPEGDDKPLKYPLMFTEVDVILISKMDVSPHFDFDIAAMEKTVRGLNPDVKIMPVSAKTSDGMSAWTSWLESELQKRAKSETPISASESPEP